MAQLSFVSDIVPKIADTCKRQMENAPTGFVFLVIYLLSVAIFLLAGLISSGETISNSFFTDPNDTFMDFFNSVMYSSDHPYTKYHVVYPPLITAFYAIIGHFSIPFIGSTAEPTVAFQLRESQMGLLLFSLTSFIAAFMFYKVFHRFFIRENPLKEIIVLSLMTAFPLIYAFERGNSMMYIVIFLMLFLMLYRSENKWLRIAAYISLGIAAGIKFYVLLFGMLILKNGDYREFVLAYSIILLITLIPFLLTDGGPYTFIRNLLNYANMVININSFRDMGGIWAMVASWFDPSTFKTVAVVSAIAFHLLVFLIIVINESLEQWKAVALLCCAVTVGTGSISVYNNCVFIIPLIMLINSQKVPSRLDYLYLLLFILIIIWIPAIPGISSLINTIHLMPIIFVYLLVIAESAMAVIHKKTKNIETKRLIQIDLKKTVTILILATLIGALITLFPLLKDGEITTITNNGQNTVRLVSDDETYELEYSFSSGTYSCSDGNGVWNITSGEYLISTDTGYVAPDEIMYISSSGSRVGHILEGDWECTVSGGTVHIYYGDYSTEWDYNAFAIVASKEGDMSYFSTSSGKNWTYLSDSDDIYDTMYSDSNKAILGIVNSKLYVNGIEKGSVSYNFKTFTDYPELKMLKTNEDSARITIPGGVNTYATGLIVPKEVSTVTYLTDEEKTQTWQMMAWIVIIGVTITVLMISTDMYKRSRDCKK